MRPAVEADLPRVVELLALGAVPGTSESAEEPRELAPYRAALREIQGGAGTLLVAEERGDLVGVCQLIVIRHFQRRGGLCAEVESVHIHPGRRGRGIGRVLLEAAIGRARVLGCYRVQLTSNTARSEAHAFYERLGFVPSHVGFKMPLT